MARDELRNKCPKWTQMRHKDSLMIKSYYPLPLKCIHHMVNPRKAFHVAMFQPFLSTSLPCHLLVTTASTPTRYCHISQELKYWNIVRLHLLPSQPRGYESISVLLVICVCFVYGLSQNRFVMISAHIDLHLFVISKSLLSIMFCLYLIKKQVYHSL